MEHLSSSDNEETYKRSMKVEDIEMEINRSKIQGINTLNLVIERGDKLEDLEDKSFHLQQTSNTFYKTSKQVHQRMWCKKVKVLLIILLMFCFFLWFVLSLTCGFDFRQCRS